MAQPNPTQLTLTHTRLVERFCRKSGKAVFLVEAAGFGNESGSAIRDQTGARV